MKEEKSQNNQVTIIGKVDSEPIFSHQVFGEKFYSLKVLVRRLSNREDRISLLISEFYIDVSQEYNGKFVMASGKFRSYNQHDEHRNHVVLSVFVKDVLFKDEDMSETNTENNKILLEGNICKKPIYRKTPMGREIAELILAVNRQYGKTDYIPCICWGGNARYAAGYDVADYVRVIGRIQSREYAKKLSDEETEMRVAYEVSASKVATISHTLIEGGSYKRRCGEEVRLGG
ncbi:MAG: single-stranded DNA-binding protein [Lachnospiraceae bacterium]